MKNIPIISNNSDLYKSCINYFVENNTDLNSRKYLMNSIKVFFKNNIPDNLLYSGTLYRFYGFKNIIDYNKNIIAENIIFSASKNINGVEEFINTRPVFNELKTYKYYKLIKFHIDKNKCFIDVNNFLNEYVIKNYIYKKEEEVLCLNNVFTDKNVIRKGEYADHILLLK